jgi:hypothetical protein
MHRRVPCVWKNRAIPAVPVVNMVPPAKTQIVRPQNRKRKKRPDPKQQNLIRFGTGHA